MRYVWLMVAIVLFAFAAACGGGDEEAAEAAEPTAEPTPAETPTPAPPAELSWEDVVEVLEPSTVMIRADFPETVVSYQGQGSGTGIVYSEDGYILTNAHVVSGAAALTVSSAGNPRQRSARFVGISPCDDLAVLQVTDMDGLEPATLGDSSEHRVGAEVATLGYPLGDILGIDISFSRGVIGQMNDTQGHYERLIQHDATVNPGNSGGPLVSRTGDVLGVNSLFIDPAFGQGMYWAIDINQAKPIISDLEEGNNRLWHGMNLVLNDYPDYFGTDQGLVVAAVASGSSASGIGVQPAFLLTHLEGLTVNTMEDICRVLRSQNEGDSVSVSFMSVTIDGYEFWEGEVVLGGSGGQDLELVWWEDFDGTTTEADDDVVEEPEGDDSESNGTTITPGSWTGVAEVWVDYWAPCGTNNDWIHYHEDTYSLETTVTVYPPHAGDTNPIMLEVSSDVTIDAVITGDMPEGSFWITTAWDYGTRGVEQYWMLELDGEEVRGELYEFARDDYEWGNYLGTYMTIDPCSADDGYEYAELQMDAETYLVGYLGEEDGMIEIGGMTEDLFRDFYIYVELKRDR
jgi:S1-C subfamily serine protease